MNWEQMLKDIALIIKNKGDDELSNADVNTIQIIMNDCYNYVASEVLFKFSNIVEGVFDLDHEELESVLDNYIEYDLDFDLHMASRVKYKVKP